MRSNFDEQLATLNEELTQMGCLCEQAIALASKALLDKDDKLAREVIAADREVDQKERDVESLCLKLLLRQQPVARDLRQISAALKMITDMERIGDQAEDIAEIVSSMGPGPKPETELLSSMARSVILMVTSSVDAYVNQDMELAAEVISQDDRVDAYFEEVKKSLVEIIVREPDMGGYALDMLMTGKYFERIGDHATNIAEWVIYSVTGVHKSEELSAD